MLKILRGQILSHLMEANSFSKSSVISSTSKGLIMPQDLQVINTPIHRLTSSILWPHSHFMAKAQILHKNNHYFENPLRSIKSFLLISIRNHIINNYFEHYYNR